jgi:chromosome segregation ATPase
MIAWDISESEKQAIAAEVRASNPLSQPLDEARAGLAQVDEQIAALDQRLQGLRAEVQAAPYDKRPALREEIDDTARDLAQLRSQRPELELKVDGLDIRIQREIGSRIVAARRAVRHAAEV